MQSYMAPAFEFVSWMRLRRHPSRGRMMGSILSSNNGGRHHGDCSACVARDFLVNEHQLEPLAARSAIAARSTLSAISAVNMRKGMKFSRIR